MHTRRAISGLLLATSSLLLVACSDHDEATPSAAARPADGATVSTVEYSYRLPKTWRDTSSTNPTLDSAGARADANGRAVEVVSVKRIAQGYIDDLGELEDLSTTALRDQGYEAIRVRPREEVAGDPAIHVAFETTKNGGRLALQEHLVVHDEKYFAVTFAFPAHRAPADRDRIAQSVLASWSWLM